MGQGKKIFGLVNQLISFLNEFDVLLNSTSRSFNMEAVFSIAKNGKSLRKWVRSNNRT